MSETSGFFVFYITPNTKFQRYFNKVFREHEISCLRANKTATLNDERLSYLIV